MTAPRKVVFLDRDGVINESPGAGRYVRTWRAFRFRAGALDMLAELFSRGYRLVVVTNQQGVEKGLIAPEELQRIHDSMCAAVARHGARIDGVFHCPHLASRNCACRKPKPGMILAAFDALGYEVDREKSWMVGDSPADVQAGAAAGLRTLLLSPGATGQGDPPALAPSPTLHVRKLADVAGIVDANS